MFLHFKGYGVTFRGPVFEFTTGYDPEATHSIDAKLRLVADRPRDGAKVGSGAPTVIDVNRLLPARDPSFPIPETIDIIFTAPMLPTPSPHGREVYGSWRPTSLQEDGQ